MAERKAEHTVRLTESTKGKKVPLSEGGHQPPVQKPGGVKPIVKSGGGHDAPVKKDPPPKKK